jgi:hypothetical protein
MHGYRTGTYISSRVRLTFSVVLAWMKQAPGGLPRWLQAS